MNARTENAFLSNPAQPSDWRATLALAVEKRCERSVLAGNRHTGPLRVQKALYPEGDAVCQILLLHPPAGIAGGDALHIDVSVDTGAHAQLTTPGAGKWYRSDGRRATQDIRLDVAPAGILEWLPQEAIVFDQAFAQAMTTLTLAAGARAIGWDIVCLGRTASGERFCSGSFHQRLRLQRPDGQALWQETLHLGGSDAALAAAVGLGGRPVFGTLWLAGLAPEPALLEALRSVAAPGVAAGISALPAVTLIRAQAASGEPLRAYFETLWALARPHFLQRPAVPPRIWRT